MPQEAVSPLSQVQPQPQLKNLINLHIIKSDQTSTQTHKPQTQPMCRLEHGWFCGPLTLEHSTPSLLCQSCDHRPGVRRATW